MTRDIIFIAIGFALGALAFVGYPKIKAYFLAKKAEATKVVGDIKKDL